MTSRTTKRAIGWGTLGVAAFLLFCRLGYYPLWDDEANTALFAKSVWRTDTLTALCDGHNLIAFRNGVELRDLKQRYLPPLPYWVTAPCLGVFGESALAARLPAALAGLAAVALLLHWIGQEYDESHALGLWSLALLGNVSFFLYCRQARYYALAILATLVLVRCYTRRGTSRWSLTGWVAASLVLLTSNYLNYAAAYACLALDYRLWGRRERPLRWSQWCWIIMPQVAIGIPLVWVWYPLGKELVAPHSGSWVREKAILFWWNFRDLDAHQFGSLVVLMAAPLLSWFGRPWLARLWVALVVYVTTVTLLSPQPVAFTRRADVRYLAPLIPLCVAISVSVLLSLRRVLPKGAVCVVAVLLFGTNALNVAALRETGFGSTPILFVRELIDPPPDPYTPVVRWLNQHVPPGRSVLVLPGYMTYPLMFHAPGPVYAWQLRYPPAAQFASLPPIHFAGQVPPDYIVAFGPELSRIVPMLRFPAEWRVRYVPAVRFDQYWKPLYRPEILAHAFRPLTRYDRQNESILILRLVPTGEEGGRAGGSGAHDGPPRASREARENLLSGPTNPPS